MVLDYVKMSVKFYPKVHQIANTLRTAFMLIAIAWVPLVHTIDPENNCREIEAAFSLEPRHGLTYFLSGGEYIEYSFLRQSEGIVGPIMELGLDARVFGSSAVFTLEDGRVVFLKGCDHFIYNTTESGTLAFLEEGTNFRDVPCSPDAAISARRGESAMVFQGCNIWSYDQDNDTFYIVGNLSDRGLPCHLDAAVEWQYRGAIYIKGTQVWMKSGNQQDLLHTDTLNLCSWYLCGEASWMSNRNRGRLTCNGDSRLCSLRLPQVTLAGLHNAGAGFNGGFSFLNCFLRNHARSIQQQLQLGIRHFDIDPSFDECGVLGSHHSSFCGGSICRMIKDLRNFLSENPHEIVTLNFNHEIRSPEKVFPALTRQIKTQLGPLLNSKFRRRSIWPKLRHAIRTNKRIFVFYAPQITRVPHNRIFNRHKWIHTEYWLGSTWRPFPIYSDCSGIVNLTDDRCQVRRAYQLVEVSIVPETRGSCIDTLAEACRPYLHDALRACEVHRFDRNTSPNVLLVDYPEESEDEVNTVFHAVYHQNVRNIHQHKASSCPVKIDAAARRSAHSDEALFFVGSKIIVYSQTQQAQVNQVVSSGVSDIDSASLNEDGTILLTRGCSFRLLSASSLQPISDQWTALTSCSSSYNASVVWNSQTHHFHGCQMYSPDQSFNLANLGLPCSVDAALALGQKMYIFKSNDYWEIIQGRRNFVWKGKTLDWTIDAVQCST